MVKLHQCMTDIWCAKDNSTFMNAIWWFILGVHVIHWTDHVLLEFTQPLFRDVLKEGGRRYFGWSIFS